MLLKIYSFAFGCLFLLQACKDSYVPAQWVPINYFLKYSATCLGL